MMCFRLRSTLLVLMITGLCLIVLPIFAPARDGNKVITNSVGMKLTLIPAGKFMMGSPAAEEERDGEELQHEVVITKPYYLGVHEVTQEQFQKVYGSNPSFFKAGPDFPVEQVSWNDAAAFCTRLSSQAAEM